MHNLSLVTRIHVLTAIKIHDQRGAEEFLADHGAEHSGEDVLVERGKKYDARALLAFAHGRATGTPLTVDELPVDAIKVLDDLGFTLTTKTALQAPARPAARVPGTRTPRTPRTPAAPKAPKAPAKPEPVVKLCPSCFTALPATGRCDYCD